MEKEALAAYSKLDHLEDRQKVGEQFINNPIIHGYIFNPSVEIQARRLKQQYNNKGKNTIEPKNFGKEYFGIGTTNNDPGAQAAMNDIMAQFGTSGLGMRISDLIKNKMKLEGKDQDKAYQILLDSIKALPKRNNSVDAELDNLFNKMGKNAGTLFGGNAKKNYKRHRKTKKARKTRRTRRNKNIK